MANSEYILKNPNKLELCYEDIKKMSVKEIGESKLQYYMTGYYLGSYSSETADPYNIIHSNDDIFGRNVTLLHKSGEGSLADVDKNTHEIIINKKIYDSASGTTEYNVLMNGKTADSNIMLIIKANTNALRPVFAIYVPDAVSPPSEPSSDDIVFILSLRLTSLPFKNINFVLNSNIYIGLSTIIYNYSGNHIRYISESCLNRLFLENCLISISPNSSSYYTTFVMSVYNDIYVQKSEIEQKHPNDNDIKNAQLIGIITTDLPGIHGDISEDNIINNCIFPGSILSNKKIMELMPIFFALDNNSGKYVMTYGENISKNFYDLNSYHYLPDVHKDQSIELGTYYSLFS